MKAPSRDSLPARGAAKLTQLVVLNNPNQVGLQNPTCTQTTAAAVCLSGYSRNQLLDASCAPQVHLKMRIRISYTSQGSTVQDTVQVDSFPGLGVTGLWRQPSRTMWIQLTDGVRLLLGWCYYLFLRILILKSFSTLQEHKLLTVHTWWTV